MFVQGVMGRSMEGGEVHMNMLSIVSGLPPSQPDSFMVNEVFFW